MNKVRALPCRFVVSVSLLGTLLAPFTFACSSRDDNDQNSNAATEPSPGSGGFNGETSATPCTRDEQCPAGSRCAKVKRGEFETTECVETAGSSPGDAGNDAPTDSPTTYSYSAWSDWGACNRTCAGGERVRKRTCVNNDGLDVACSHCGGECEERESCGGSAPCAYCESQTFSLPTAQGGTCTATLPRTIQGERGNSFVRGDGSETTGRACLKGDIRATSHSGTLTGGEFGTCLNYCDIRADCGADGTWNNATYTW